jgi:hypothetical protein
MLFDIGLCHAQRCRSRLCSLQPALLKTAPPPNDELNTVLFASLDGMRPVMPAWASSGPWKRSLDQSDPRPCCQPATGASRWPIVTGTAQSGRERANRLAVAASLLHALGISRSGGRVRARERKLRARFGVRRGRARAGRTLGTPTPETLFTATVIAGTARGHLWSRTRPATRPGEGSSSPEISHYRRMTSASGASARMRRHHARTL